MNPISRSEFSKSRPLPAIGMVLGVIVDALNLADPNTYPGDLQKRPGLKSAITILSTRTFERVESEGMVKSGTRSEICKALAVCFTSFPLPGLSDVPADALSECVHGLWTAYEGISGDLSRLNASDAILGRALWRHLTIEMALRAGALGYLCGDQSQVDSIPIWGDAERFRSVLRGRVRECGSRSKISSRLNRSASEVDRWLDLDDVPNCGDALRLEAIEPEHHGRSLLRYIAGRRLWKSVEAEIPEDMRRECLEKFARIRRATAESLRKELDRDAAATAIGAVRALLLGRIEIRGLGQAICAAEPDPLWQWHALAFRTQAGAWNPKNLVFCCETYGSCESVSREIRSRNPKIELPSVESMLRRTIESQEHGIWMQPDSPSEADLLKRAASRPTPGTWNTLGRKALAAGNRREAEEFYKKGLAIDPGNEDLLADLAMLQINTDRTVEAEKTIEMVALNPQNEPIFRYIRARILHARRATDAAEVEFLFCLNRKFKIPECLGHLAKIALVRGDAKSAREFQKRANEIGGN